MQTISFVIHTVIRTKRLTRKNWSESEQWQLVYPQAMERFFPGESMMLSMGRNCTILGALLLMQGTQLRADTPAVDLKTGAAATTKPTAEEQAAIDAIAAEKLSDTGLSPEVYAFKKRVYNLHVARGIGAGRKRIYDLPADQLGIIAGTDIKMRSDAALQLSRLLEAARLDVDRDLASTGTDAPTILRRARARQVRELGVGNAYRSASRQFGIWDSNFQKYYEATSEKRRALPGGEFGPEAAETLREYIGVRVAAPGFSNHQGGIAVDLALRLKPDPQEATAPAKELGASMTQIDPWKESWFWNWLKVHAGEYGFVEYVPEPWHWEYKPQEAKANVTK
jgi:LAS superfamily LD-carboxypeptidase LdcB